MSDALHQQALLALETADMAAAHAPDLGLVAPHTLEAVTPEFVATVFAERAPGAQVVVMEVADGHDGMTSRRKWVLEWDEAGKSAGLPTTLFAKATPDGPYLRETLAMLHMAENEVLFYRHLAGELAGLVPQSFFGAVYAGGRFLLLTEDIAARACRPYWMGDDVSLDHAKAVMETLAAIHGRYWNSPRFEDDMAFARPRSRRFGASWHKASMVHARTTFLDSEAGKSMSVPLQRLLRTWNDGFDTVVAYWDRLDFTLLHGDSHMGNTFSTPAGEAGFFDWQVLYRGPGLRDVAYFLYSALTPEQMIEGERICVDHYLDALSDRGVSFDREEAWALYPMFILDRWDAAIKSTVRGGYGHPSRGYARQFAATAEALIAHDVPGKLDKVLRHGRL